jgi:hypothetical protein
MTHHDVGSGVRTASTTSVRASRAHILKPYRTCMAAEQINYDVPQYFSGEAFVPENGMPIDVWFNLNEHVWLWRPNLRTAR